jgi:serine/threonine-protein kinase
VTTPVAFSGLVATPSDRVMPTIGHIGRYALKYQLGEGGLGTVFAAHDPLLSRLIAVKTLNVKVADEERESFNALFLNEARAAGGLSHPHIVTVFDAGISDERAYIAMELLKGRDLRQLRQEGWRATPAQAALIIRRVADALAFAHSKGVIHRDIKPANIFMVGRTQPRVLDFGIARVAHQQDSDDPHSGAGSPYYMAPEQVRRELSDRRADVFSLGVVLYELLTDVKPFRGESLAQIRDAVLNHEPPLANKVDPAVPKALAAIAARAMAKDPEHRFRSARSFARELRQWLDENPPAPTARRPAPFVAPPSGAAASCSAPPSPPASRP